jgi:1,4-dihydroxy-2-naphthoyl-CoA hydrolase
VSISTADDPFTMQPMETDPAGFPVTGTIHEALGIRTVAATPDSVLMEMEVGPKVLQPLGIMHGGASAVLAESAASVGAHVACRPGSRALGIELNISHLKAVRSGTITASARPVRKGRTLHVWVVDIADADGGLVAVGRCTLAIRESVP